MIKPRLAIVLAAGVVVAACSSPPPPAPSASPTVTATPEPEVLLAMTGQPAPDSWKPRPVIVVKVDNTVAGQPQIGIGQADLVIEEPVEGGLTRLAGFFESRLPRVVGPARSVRISDIGLVEPVRATVVASGGAPDSLAAFERADVTLYDETSPAHFRDAGRVAPYNLFVNPREIDRMDKGRLPQQSYLSFGDSELPKGQPAKDVTITFSPSRSETWQWDRKSGHWQLDGQKFRPDNILVMDVTTRDTGERDAAGSPIPEVISTGGGRGYLMASGEAHKINWSKVSTKAPFELADARGREVEVPPGRTWVALIVRGTGQVDFD